MSKSPDSSGYYGPPSYEDVASSTSGTPGTTTGTPGNTGAALLTQLATTRSQQIKHTVTKHVYPFLSDRASRGLSTTTIVLIPSDILPDASPCHGEKDAFAFADADADAAGPELLGLSAFLDESVEEVRLSGPLNVYEFWRQPGVLEEVRSVLAETLSSSKLFKASQEQVRASPTTWDVLPARSSKSRGLSIFGKKPVVGEVDLFTPTQAAWLGATIPAPRINVKVELEDICLRTMTEFGLYETISRPSVVVRVEAKC